MHGCRTCGADTIINILYTFPCIVFDVKHNLCENSIIVITNKNDLHLWTVIIEGSVKVIIQAENVIEKLFDI